MRKFLLLICVAFTFFAFCWPCTIFPFTNYTYTTKSEVGETTIKYNFNFTGKVKVTTITKIGDVSNENKTEMLYRISFKNKTIKFSETKEGFKDAIPVSLNNIYSFGFNVAGIKAEMKNSVAMWTSVGVGAVAVLLILTIPKKRK